MEKRGRKAQVSIEFLIIVGFAMLMTVPLLLIFYRQSESVTTEVSAAQADKVASEIRDSADEVYYLGSPSKKTLSLFFPEGITSIEVSGNRIKFSISSSSGNFDIVKWTVGNISSSSNISIHSGIHHVSIESRTYDILVKDV